MRVPLLKHPAIGLLLLIMLAVAFVAAQGRASLPAAAPAVSERAVENIASPRSDIRPDG